MGPPAGCQTLTWLYNLFPLMWVLWNIPKMTSWDANISFLLFQLSLWYFRVWGVRIRSQQDRRLRDTWITYQRISELSSASKQRTELKRFRVVGGVIPLSMLNLMYAKGHAGCS